MIIRKNLNSICVVIWMAVLGLAGLTQATTYHVSPGQSIQVAIDASSDWDDIEVAPGTYPETINLLGKAIRLYSSGGPAVTTIDATGLDSSVVTCDSNEGPNTILEGFTITGGTGTTVDAYKYGGGMYNLNSSPTVTNCTFTVNSVRDGGGMSNTNSSPTVTNCSFSNNTASNLGAGMSNFDNSSPTVTECTFTANNAHQGGSGMCNWGNSNPTVTDCTFTDNGVSVEGGGIVNVVSSPTVTNCIFNSNDAQYGGGMYNNQSNPMVTNCIFINNSATTQGGGMINQTSSSPTVINCTFSGNAGGGMSNYGHGGASYPTVTNCILWGDTPDEIYNVLGSVPTITYSDVQGGYTGTGNIDADPLFLDAPGGDFRLMPDSPCIDAADTTAVPTAIFVDVDRNPRGVDDPASPDTGISVLGITVDMGAYEFQPCRIPGDNNCDGVVDFKDIAILCNNWLVGTESEL